MKIGIVGSGEVAQVLASGCLKHGHEVMVGVARSVRLGYRRHGQGRGRPSHRATVHALVHTEISPQRVESRVRAAEGVRSAGGG